MTEYILDEDALSSYLKFKDGERTKIIKKKLQNCNKGYILRELELIELDLRGLLRNKRCYEGDLKYLIRCEPGQLDQIKEMAYKVKRAEIEIASKLAKEKALKAKITRIKDLETPLAQDLVHEK